MNRRATANTQHPELRSIIDTVYIVAYKENTSNLEIALEQEGFRCEVVRSNYTPTQKLYSRACRCLVNHAAAWKKVSVKSGHSMIVEADFVPVKGIGRMAAPYNTERTPDHVGWLYAGGPVAYHIDRDSYVYGHACTPVAIMISPKVALAMLEFYEEEIRDVKEGEYRAWDTYISTRLRWKKGVRSYLPYRQYGEHGGIPNKEHKLNNIRQWHQADRLAGPLCFLPLYAKNSRLRYYLIRFRGYLRGWYRLLIWKLFERKPWFDSPQKWELLWWGVRRIL